MAVGTYSVGMSVGYFGPLKLLQPIKKPARNKQKHATLRRVPKMVIERLIAWWPDRSFDFISQPVNLAELAL
jgi:hypothetical protein